MLVWKNILVLISMVWLSVSYAGPKIQSETIEDATAQRIEHHHSHRPQRSVAAKHPAVEQKMESEAPEAKDSKLPYWHWSEKQHGPPKH